jgi:predicted AlkP superfamily phosphohydrolase/phosphomutase
LGSGGAPTAGTTGPRGRAGRRVALIGLDCGTPELLFERYADDMPTLGRLRRQALWGPLESTAPPLSIPAWLSMLTGRTPGELGVYGFRNRTDHGYGALAFATSRWVRVPRVWDLLGQAGRDSVLIGVPGTYPPSPLRGSMVTCFMTPSTDAQFTFPADLREEVQRVTGGYTIDVAGFRSEDKARVAQQIFDMTEQRFALARHLATTRPWEFLAVADMGPDRLHHGFWGACDPGHPRYRPGNAYEHVVRDYYRALDRHLAGLLEVLPDDTTVAIASDHGARPMLGGFCLNEWLVREGLLVLAEPPAGPTPIGKAVIDWSQTTAWGDGGFYGRLFLNVEGREPRGTVPRRDFETVREQIASRIERLPDPEGRPLGNRVLRPGELYPEVRGAAPDLIVYFGDLRWRAVGSLGLGHGLYTSENDTGPDDANHSEQGVLVLAGEGLPHGRQDGLSIYDVAPTLQALLGLPAAPGPRGRVLG